MKRFIALALCALGITGATLLARSQAAPAPVNMSAFRLDGFLKSRGFVAERAPVKTFGSLSAKYLAPMPVVNQRWFHGKERIEFSALVFPDEKSERSFDTLFVRGHQLPPLSPFACPAVGGVRDNIGGKPILADGVYNFISVGRTYIVIEATRWPMHPAKPSSVREFGHIIEGVKGKLIAAAKAVPRN